MASFLLSGVPLSLPFQPPPPPRLQILKLSWRKSQLMKIFDIDCVFICVFVDVYFLCTCACLSLVCDRVCISLVVLNGVNT